MTYAKIILVGAAICILAACAPVKLEMAAAPALDVQGLNKHPYAVGLFIPKELGVCTYSTTVTYPLGEQTTLLFQKNLPLVFQEVVDVESLNPPQDVKLILEPSIVKFFANVPYPAYNPYVAEMTYHVDVFDRKGEKIFAQTAKGEAQTSKGLFSGFVAQRLFAEAAETAMENAMRQLLEGLSEAQELMDRPAGQ